MSQKFEDSQYLIRNLHLNMKTFHMLLKSALLIRESSF